MIKFKELKNKSDKELGAMLLQAKEDLQTLKFKVAGRQYKNVREIRVQKQLIAHILTIQNQKKIQKTGNAVKEEPVVVSNN
ncbi:MAG: 50S ribosomal protein L29 [Patescibacteria group bacterium]